MNRYIYFIILSAFCLTCIYGFELKTYFDDNSMDNTKGRTNLVDIEGRRRKKGHYFIYPFYSWHALSWIYWIKVKIIVVAFFVGTSIVWGAQYLGKYFQKCSDVGHVHYGHYRSFENPQINKFLQNIKHSRKRRNLKNTRL